MCQQAKNLEWKMYILASGSFEKDDKYVFKAREFLTFE